MSRERLSDRMYFHTLLAVDMLKEVATVAMADTEAKMTIAIKKTTASRIQSPPFLILEKR